MLFAFHYYFISNQNLKIWLKQQWKWILGVGGLLASVLLFKKIYGSGLLKASIVDLTAWDYFRTQIGVIPFEYFRKIIFPFNLTIEPGFQVVQHWRSLIPICGIIILGIFFILWIKLSGIKKQSKKLSVISEVENNLINVLGTKVKITLNTNKRGKIHIDFFSKDDLQRIIDIISKK